MGGQFGNGKVGFKHWWVSFLLDINYVAVCDIFKETLHIPRPSSWIPLIFVVRKKSTENMRKICEEQSLLLGRPQMSQTTHNVDPTELAKFESHADEWWNPNGPFQTLHEINPLRLNYIEKYFPLKEQSVLDIGCGGGILAEGMAQRGAHVIGIDLAESSIEKARRHAAKANVTVEYFRKDAESMANENPGAFDAITCLELLEHVPYPQELVNACSKALAPGGSAFFSTINRNLKSFLFAIVGAEYILKMIPKGTHEYVKLIKPAELIGWCRADGLEVQHLTGLHFNPLTQRYRLGGKVNVNYFCWCIKK